MFEEFFERPHILERHRSAPFPLERYKYLSHLRQIGQAHCRLLVISNIILDAAKHLNIGNGEPINLKMVAKAAEGWIERRTLPNTQARSVGMARTDFVATTARWLRFLDRLDEAHPPLPFADQLEEFLKNLREERGLADSTVEHRTRTLAQFFRWLISRGESIATVDPRDITEYFSVPRSPSWTRATVKSYAECLRTFFRYAESRSWCNPGLAATIDAPRIYSFEPLPRGPAWEDVQRLIASVNGDNPSQIRNRAIILLLAVYGFRMGEVCKLTLDDICWETEVIRVRRSKQRRVQDYPLTEEVGAAIIRYLKDGRPKSSHRAVFLTLRAPYQPIRSGIGNSITELMKKLGIQLPRYGPHALRHACAAHLLSQGFSLKEIGDHLGHRSAQATQIYAKVDLPSLRPVARQDLSALVEYAETHQRETGRALTEERLVALRPVVRQDLSELIQCADTCPQETSLTLTEERLAALREVARVNLGGVL